MDSNFCCSSLSEWTCFKLGSQIVFLCYCFVIFIKFSQCSIRQIFDWVLSVFTSMIQVLRLVMVKASLIDDFLLLLRSTRPASTARSFFPEPTLRPRKPTKEPKMLQSPASTSSSITGSLRPDSLTRRRSPITWRATWRRWSSTSRKTTSQAKSTDSRPISRR